MVLTKTEPPTCKYALSKVATGRPFSILVPMVGLPEGEVPSYEFPDLSDQVERALPMTLAPPPLFASAASNHITYGILSGYAIVVIAVPA